MWGTQPGLKPLDSIGLIQGAEAPCSLRYDKNPTHRKVRDEWGTRQGRDLLGERFGRLWRCGVRRGPSRSKDALRMTAKETRANTEILAAPE
jgi:hypothetical protein